MPLAVVARRMRQPIAEIDATIADLEKQLQPDRSLVGATGPSFDRLRHNITLLLRMMNDLLALDEPPSESVMFNRRSVDLVAVVERTLLRCPGGLRIRFATKPDGPAQVTCDESRIALVVSNLIRNAIEHGTGAVEVSVLPSPGGWTLAIENDGALTPTRDPLLRSPGDDQTGRGLGLYLVRRFVEAHRGTFSISSDGHRVRATVFLPT